MKVYMHVCIQFEVFMFTLFILFIMYVKHIVNNTLEEGFSSIYTIKSSKVIYLIFKGYQSQIKPCFIYILYNGIVIDCNNIITGVFQ